MPYKTMHPILRSCRSTSYSAENDRLGAVHLCGTTRRYWWHQCQAIADATSTVTASDVYRFAPELDRAASLYRLWLYPAGIVPPKGTIPLLNKLAGQAKRLHKALERQIRAPARRKTEAERIADKVSALSNLTERIFEGTPSLGNTRKRTPEEEHAWRLLQVPLGPNEDNLVRIFEAIWDYRKDTPPDQLLVFAQKLGALEQAALDAVRCACDLRQQKSCGPPADKAVGAFTDMLIAIYRKMTGKEGLSYNPIKNEYTGPLIRFLQAAAAAVRVKRSPAQWATQVKQYRERKPKVGF